MKILLYVLIFILMNFQSLAQVLLKKENTFLLKSTDIKFLCEENLFSHKQIVSGSCDSIFKKDLPKNQKTDWCWLKIDLKTEEQETKNWVMTFAAQDSIEFYIKALDSTQKAFQMPVCKKSGKLIPLRRKDYAKTNTNIPAIIFELLPQKNYIIYVRLKLTTQIEIAEQTKYEQNYGEFLQEHHLFQGIFQGVMLIMALYNLLIFVINRDKVYGYYTLYVFCVAFYFMCMTDFLLPKWLANDPWALEIVSFTGIIQFVFYSQFSLLFIKAKEYTPKWNKALQKISAFVTLFVCLSIFNIIFHYFFADQNSWTNSVYDFLVSLDFFVILFISVALAAYTIKLCFVKIPLKTYFILGGFSLNGGIALLLLLTAFQIPITRNLLTFCFEASIFVEILCFSLGLGARMKLNEQEKRKAQEILFEKSKENERLLKDQNSILEQKVAEKTKDLQTQNQIVKQSYEELAVINEELFQTQEEILAQRDLLENKNSLLEEYTNKVEKSIGAAKLIQKAILPTKEKMKELFPEHFVLFKPKDTVSGDFWWVNQIENTNYLIVADCTGHGVSGAMLTMIGSSLLDRIILVLGITSPAQILEKLHQEVQNALQQEKNHNREGMDIAVLVWKEKNNACELTFAAAKRPLYYVLDKKIEKISGSRKHIGGLSESKKYFENYNLILSKGTNIYLCSDGFADQNDVERAHFTEKRLLNLLESMQDLTLTEQKISLKAELNQHMEKTEQRDDILLIGVKI
ncbi:MAG: hypothetical protein EAZ97_04580 [Bacteroidetes bacterium]|nr:MAG: hypothetical protein EAZ97_04580 [Bacteroidota bacterium]